MGFLSGLVVGQNRPLAEYSLIEGNHIEIALKLIKSMNRNNKNAFSDHGDYVFTLKMSQEGFIFICLASRDVALQAQNVFLDEMEEKWNLLIKPNIVDYQPYSQNLAFSNTISDLISNYNTKVFSNSMPIDRKMANLHITIVSGNELNVIKRNDIKEMTGKKILMKLRRIKNRVFSNRNQWFSTVMILLIILIALFLLYANFTQSF